LQISGTGSSAGFDIFVGEGSKVGLVDKSHGGVERQSPIRGLGNNNYPEAEAF